MRYAVIDTETNGLFRHRDENGAVIPSDSPGQPRMASFSMILLNEDLSIQEKYEVLITPDGWSMTSEATAINGLTDEVLAVSGKPIKEVMEVYTQAVKEGFMMVAFNAQHDLRCCRAELRRAGMPDLFEETKNVCVMRKAKGVIPRRDGKKSWPSLADCRAFLKISHDAAHSAGADALSALEVLKYLHSQGVDLTPEVHFAKNKPDDNVTAPPEQRMIPAIPRSDALPPVADRPVSRPRSSALPPLAEEKIPE